MGLFDMVMIKDNHIAAAGGIEAAVEGARDYLRRNDLDMGVEVGDPFLGCRSTFFYFYYTPLSFLLRALCLFEIFSFACSDPNFSALTFAIFRLVSSTCGNRCTSRFCEDHEI
jgi:hypothetical protein